MSRIFDIDKNSIIVRVEQKLPGFSGKVVATGGLQIARGRASFTGDDGQVIFDVPVTELTVRYAYWSELAVLKHGAHEYRFNVTGRTNSQELVNIANTVLNSGLDSGNALSWKVVKIIKNWQKHLRNSNGN